MKNLGSAIISIYLGHELPPEISLRSKTNYFPNSTNSYIFWKKFFYASGTNFGWKVSRISLYIQKKKDVTMVNVSLNQFKFSQENRVSCYRNKGFNTGTGRNMSVTIGQHFLQGQFPPLRHVDLPDYFTKWAHSKHKIH